MKIIIFTLASVFAFNCVASDCEKIDYSQLLKVAYDEYLSDGFKYKGRRLNVGVESYKGDDCLVVYLFSLDDAPEGYVINGGTIGYVFDKRTSKIIKKIVQP